MAYNKVDFNVYYFLCPSSNLDTISRKLLLISTENKEVNTSEQTVRKLFQKFYSGDESLEDEGCRGWTCIFDYEQLQALVEQDPSQTFGEMF